jgi:hypothetical protein
VQGLRAKKFSWKGPIAHKKTKKYLFFFFFFFLKKLNLNLKKKKKKEREEEERAVDSIQPIHSFFLFFFLSFYKTTL